ncbi:MAG: ankyrin repeat domain-containing protein [Phycisphaeraceae bacterium JB051]
MHPGSHASNALYIVGTGLLSAGLLLLIAAMVRQLRDLIKWPRRYSSCMLLLGLLMLTLSSHTQRNQQSLCEVLCQAIDQGEDQRVIQMLTKNPELRSQCMDGIPLLHRAIRSKRLAIMMVVLTDDNLNIEKCDEQGRTPLVYALQLQQKFMVATLINRNANIHAKTPDGRTTLEMIKELGDDYARLIAMPD